MTRLLRIIWLLLLLTSVGLSQEKINGSRTFVGTSSINESVANEGATGTTLNKLAKFTTANPSTAIIAATTDTGGIKGIVTGGAGITGNAEIAVAGEASCVFDGATTAGDYVKISSTTAGDCSDAGVTAPLTGQILGRVLSTNGGAGTYAISIAHGLLSQNSVIPLTIANAGTTGTTVNTLTKLIGAPSTAVIAATTDTAGIIGITAAGAGTTGNATVVTGGSTTCQFDGATTAGDYVVISNATAGNCHDTGAATFPTTGQVIGRVLSTNGGVGAYTIDFFPPEIQASTGGAGALSSITAATQSHTIANGNNPQIWNWAQTSNSQAAQTFGETTAATGGTITSNLNNQNELAVTTVAGSTATPLAVTQGSNTSSTAVPVATVQTTWNNASTVFLGWYENVTSTASNSGSLPLDIQVNAADIMKLDRLGTFTIATGGAISIGNTQINSGNYGANIYTQTTNFVAGKDTSSTSNQAGGPGTYRSADNTGATGTITGGTTTLRGGDVSSSTAAAVAGGVTIRPGRELGGVATTGPSNGKLIISQIFIKGAANTAGALQCYSADDTVTDCSAASTNGVGVAVATNSNAVDVQTDGIVTITFASASPSAGWFACSTTLSSGVNIVVQSAACTAGQQVGLVTKGGSSITTTTALLRFK